MSTSAIRLRQSLKAHPVADLLPPMSAAEYDELRESIRANGLREPVTVHRDGRIIDGRHRARICLELCLPLETRTFDGEDNELLAFVLDLNLKRRHLSETQRAAVAAELANLREGRPKTASIEAVSQSTAAHLLNVSRSAVQRAEIVRKRGVPELFEAIKRDKLAASQAAMLSKMSTGKQRQALGLIESGVRAQRVVLSARRTERAQQIEQASAAAPLTELGRKFALFYADPPYDFRTWSDAGILKSPALQYPTMSIPEICAVSVSQIAARDAVLFLWTPNFVPSDAVAQILVAWCFTYKSQMVWVKEKPGLGHLVGWCRSRHETLIIATRGKMPPPPHPRDSVFEFPRPGPHSAKPTEIRDWIANEAYPGLAGCELFARGATAPGWIAWGHEALQVGVPA